MSDTANTQILITAMLHDGRFSGYTKPDIEKAAAAFAVIARKVFKEDLTPESLTEAERSARQEPKQINNTERAGLYVPLVSLCFD